MKKNIIHSRKFRHGSLSVALTVLIIAAVVVLNVIATALAQRYSWMYIDMTAEKLYTLSDDCIELLDKSFIEIMETRKKLNVQLPLANHEISKENVKTSDSNLSVAELAVKTAQGNIDIAAINKLAFEQSVIKARTNMTVAETNLEVAKAIVKVAAENAGRSENEVVPEDKMTDEEKLAQKNLKVAEENIEIAKKNLKIAAENEKTAKENLEIDKYNKQNALNPGDEGYKEHLPFKHLLDYKEFFNVSEYEEKYGDEILVPQITYENEGIANKNLEIAKENLEIAKKNAEIAKENEKIAKENADNDVIKGEDGYKELKEYLKAKEYIPFKTISNFKEPGVFKNVSKTSSYDKEKSLYETDVKVKIMFCDMPDNLMKNETQRLVFETAKDLQEKFPEYIEVSHIDIWNNSSAVQKYKTTAMSTINSTNVIIESGTEFRVCALRAFYVFNNLKDSKPWAYRGEKTFAANILAVSQAEAPIACITINHNEGFKDFSLLNTLGEAGYKVQTIDLAYQEIPNDCRLVVIYNPKEDFMVKDGVSDISEIEKLDKYLNGLSCSMMVFVNPETPKLKNLEEYLEEWGVVINRHKDTLGDEYNHVIKEAPELALSSDGFTFAGSYVKNGVGAGIYKSLTESAYPPKIVFKNSTSLSYSDLYEKSFYRDPQDPDSTTDEYWFGSYNSNGVQRSVYDVFTTSKNAVAMANGLQVKKSNAEEPIKLMTITRETRMIDNQNSDNATVLVSASTDFATESLLSSAVYGNTDIILSAARGMGKEFIPVDLDLKPFASREISELSTESKNRYTAVLTIVPSVLVIGAGIFVLVRRKYS